MNSRIQQPYMSGFAQSLPFAATPMVPFWPPCGLSMFPAQALQQAMRFDSSLPSTAAFPFPAFSSPVAAVAASLSPSAPAPLHVEPPLVLSESDSFARIQEMYNHLELPHGHPLWNCARQLDQALLFQEQPVLLTAQAISQATVSGKPQLLMYAGRSALGKTSLALAAAVVANSLHLHLGKPVEEVTQKDAIGFFLRVDCGGFSKGKPSASLNIHLREHIFEGSMPAESGTAVILLDEVQLQNSMFFSTIRDLLEKGELPAVNLSKKKLPAVTLPPGWKLIIIFAGNMSEDKLTEHQRSCAEGSLRELEKTVKQSFEGKLGFSKDVTTVQSRMAQRIGLFLPYTPNQKDVLVSRILRIVKVRMEQEHQVTVQFGQSAHVLVRKNWDEPGQDMRLVVQTQLDRVALLLNHQRIKAGQLIRFSAIADHLVVDSIDRVREKPRLPPDLFPEDAPNARPREPAIDKCGRAFVLDAFRLIDHQASGPPAPSASAPAPPVISAAPVPPDANAAMSDVPSISGSHDQVPPLMSDLSSFSPVTSAAHVHAADDAMIDVSSVEPADANTMLRTASPRHNLLDLTAIEQWARPYVVIDEPLTTEQVAMNEEFLQASPFLTGLNLPPRAIQNLRFWDLPREGVSWLRQEVAVRWIASCVFHNIDGVTFTRRSYEIALNEYILENADRSVRVLCALLTTLTDHLKTAALSRYIVTFDIQVLTFLRRLVCDDDAHGTRLAEVLAKYIVPVVTEGLKKAHRDRWFGVECFKVTGTLTSGHRPRLALQFQYFHRVDGESRALHQASFDPPYMPVETWALYENQSSGASALTVALLNKMQMCYLQDVVQQCVVLSSPHTYAKHWSLTGFRSEHPSDDSKRFAQTCVVPREQAALDSTLHEHDVCIDSDEAAVFGRWADSIQAGQDEQNDAIYEDHRADSFRRGVTNVGNSCWFSAMLMALLTLDDGVCDWGQWLQPDAPVAQRWAIVRELLAVSQEANLQHDAAEQSVIALSNELATLELAHHKSTTFAFVLEGVMKDADEALRLLLDLPPFHFLRPLFQFDMVETNICFSCQRQTRRLTPAVAFNFAVERDQHLVLQEAFKEWCSINVLEEHCCPGCSEKSVRTCTRASRLPSVLAVKVSRPGGVDNHAPVHFEELLRVSHECLDYQEAAATAASTEYRLHSVITWKDSHYMTWLPPNSGVPAWRLFDDGKSVQRRMASECISLLRETVVQLIYIQHPWLCANKAAVPHVVAPSSAQADSLTAMADLQTGSLSESRAPSAAVSHKRRHYLTLSDPFQAGKDVTVVAHAAGPAIFINLVAYIPFADSSARFVPELGADEFSRLLASLRGSLQYMQYPVFVLWTYPLIPPPQNRNRRMLSLEQSEQIMRALPAGPVDANTLELVPQDLLRDMLVHRIKKSNTNQGAPASDRGEDCKMIDC